MSRFLFCLLCLILPTQMSWAAPAQDESLTYTVRRGDTLITLADRYMLSPDHYRVVQKANGIANPRQIAVGRKIRIARNLLKFTPEEARLVSVRGNVSLIRGKTVAQASSGLMLSEGMTLQTAASSFATFALDNGSRVSLPSNSQLKVARLRRYLIDSSLDYDFDVANGGVRSTVTPLKTANDRYRVRTPKATSAVRGTDFQTRFDPSADAAFAEVVDGALAVDVPGGRTASVEQGSGLAVDRSGKAVAEALLPPIDAPSAGRTQKDAKLAFELPLPAAASALRISLASDAGFTDVIADKIVSESQSVFENIEDGNYFVRLRAISANGLQGMPSTYAFKRRQNAVSASAGASDLGYLFKWDSSGKGIFRYHFQLFKDRPTGTAVIDETGLDQQQIVLSELAPGDYYWRVASVQFVDGEANSNWTSFEKLTVSAE